eukprot:CAMPEP_0198284844 /NCGR_PEP_ID=MMETSP1449-20131203/4244_1 /TAXON_ID=420275 /ORGANISM="Attheya septentrionalis, Strain CCMP2084" /LENGTH=1074 /DNA_ID=CAMNT_0043982063 /DNA_START=106 /DNA_END=3327 /DNA_ORIENTATION=+
MERILKQEDPPSTPATLEMVKTVDLSKHPRGKPLGLVLKPLDDSQTNTTTIVVAGWESLGPIQESGCVHLGDRLVHINGAPVTHMTCAQIMVVLRSMLKVTRRLQSIGFASMTYDVDIDPAKSKSDNGSDISEKAEHFSTNLLVEEIESLQSLLKQLATQKVVEKRGSERGFLARGSFLNRVAAGRNTNEKSEEKIIKSVKKELDDAMTHKAEMEMDYLNIVIKMEDDKRELAAIEKDMSTKEKLIDEKTKETKDVSTRLAEHESRNKALEDQARQMKEKLEEWTRIITKLSEENASLQKHVIDKSKLYAELRQESATTKQSMEDDARELEVLMESEISMRKETIASQTKELETIRTTLNNTEARNKELEDKVKAIERNDEDNMKAIEKLRDEKSNLQNELFATSKLFDESIQDMEDSKSTLAVMKNKEEADEEQLMTKTKETEEITERLAQKENETKTMEEELIKISQTLTNVSDEKTYLQKEVATKSKLHDEARRELEESNEGMAAIMSKSLTDEKLIVSKTIEIEEIVANLTEKEVRVKVLEEEVAHLDKKLNAGICYIENLSDENLNLETELREKAKLYDGQIQAVEKDKQALADSMSAPSENVKKEMHDKIKEKIEDLSNRLTERENRVKDLEEEVMNVKESLNDRTHDIVTLSDENANLQKEVASKLQLCDELKKELEESKREMVAGLIKPLSAEKLTVSKTVESDETKTTFAEKEAKIKVLEEEVMELQHKLETRTADTEKLSNENSARQNEIATKSELSIELTPYIEESKPELAATTKEMATKDSKLNDLTREIEILNTRYVKNERRKKDMEEEMTLVVQKLEDGAYAFEELSEENVRLQNEIATKTEAQPLHQSACIGSERNLEIIPESDESQPDEKIAGLAKKDASTSHDDHALRDAIREKENLASELFRAKNKLKQKSKLLKRQQSEVAYFKFLAKEGLEARDLGSEDKQFLEALQTLEKGNLLLKDEAASLRKSYESDANLVGVLKKGESKRTNQRSIYAKIEPSKLDAGANKKPVDRKTKQQNITQKKLEQGELVIEVPVRADENAALEHRILKLTKEWEY